MADKTVSPDGKVTLFVDGFGVEIPKEYLEDTKLSDGDSTDALTIDILRAKWEAKHDIRALADDQYPTYVKFGETGELVTTHEQRTALFRKWKQDDQGLSWGEFSETACPTFGCDDAITVPWCGMWLCIETDGYTHS